MAECGHVVGGGYVKPEINKLEAVEKFLVLKQRRRSGHSLDSQVITGALLKVCLHGRTTN